MELHRLRYFVAVAEHEHFHRAAETLHVAQPALSRQIKLLEEQLGFALFERLPRGVRLTNAGRAFLVDTKRVMADLDRAVGNARDIAEGTAGSLRIAFIEITSSLGILPRTIQAFRQSFPAVRLSLQQLDSVVQVARLREHSIDIGWLFGGTASDDNIVKETVHAAPFVLALPIGHPLLAQPQIMLRDLAAQPFIWSDRSLRLPLIDQLMAACIGHGLVPKIAQEVVGISHILSLVSVGIGLGFVPSSAKWRPQEGIVLRQVCDLDLLYRVDLAWRADNSSPALQQFVRTALDRADIQQGLSSADMKC
jgi:DNA-binding transcriptional LysR family regulator